MLMFAFAAERHELSNSGELHKRTKFDETLIVSLLPGGTDVSLCLGVVGVYALFGLKDSEFLG